MIFNELEIIALVHDILEYGLSKGDTGTIVEVYGDGKAYEVEFVDVSGKTVALLNLTSADIHSVTSDKIFSIQGAIGSLGYPALGTADWENPYLREPYIVDNTSITVNTDSSRIESGEKQILYQTA